MGLQSCVHCGKETGEGELYCPECQAISGARKPRSFWIFSILFSVLLLSLTGLLLWHGGISFGSLSLDSILGKPAAVVNGEPIPISDLRERVKASGQCWSGRMEEIFLPENRAGHFWAT